MTQHAPSLSTHDEPQPLSYETAPGVVPRGTIVVIPGRGERPGVYERLGRRLAVDGYPVRVLAEPTGDLNATRSQVADIFADADSVRPHVLIGSDVGALVAVPSAVADPDSVDGLVLAGLPVTTEQANQHSWDSELDARTECPVHRQRLSDTELLRQGALDEPIQAAWISSARLEDVACPVLGLHGDLDEISPLVSAKEAYRQVAALELNAVVGGRHDALNDKSHRSVAATVILFLERLRSGTPLVPIVAPVDLRAAGAGSS
jgi:alpha-beta hydrolase superfamily lysophospholipase